MPAKKYIFVNGQMVENPAWAAEQAAQHIPVATVVYPYPEDLAKPSAPPLVAACSIADLGAMQEASAGVVVASAATQRAMMAVQEDEYVAAFNAGNKFDELSIIDELSKVCARNCIPLGLLDKLLKLSGRGINCIVDDSGSMGSQTDSVYADFREYLSGVFGVNKINAGQKMLRWQEAEDRIHTLVELLAYIPTADITIGFLNRSNKITLSHQGKSPAEFVADAHLKIRAAFTAPPTGYTPTRRALQAAFTTTYPVPTNHYLFTDGAPTDTYNHETEDEVKAVMSVIKARTAPETKPLTLISCTNEDGKTDWMKKVEQETPNAAELDDPRDEAEEVYRNQGAKFPYHKGLYLACLLAGCLDEELDGIDDKRPLTRFTLQNLMGRVVTDQEYESYWSYQPKHKDFTARYAEFLHAKQTTVQLCGPEPDGVATVAGLFSRMKVGW